MNYCTFQDFDLNEYYLKFNVVVNFHGYDPITKKEYDLTNEVFPFHVEFSQPLIYDESDVLLMVNCYIRCAAINKEFDEYKILLQKTDKSISYDYSAGKNYMLLNSGGFDATSIFYLLNDRLKERLYSVSIIHTDDKRRTTEKLVKLNTYVNEPLFITYVKELNVIKLLANPANDIFLRFLAYKTFNIKQTLYGDVVISLAFNEENIKRNKDFINFAFYNFEFTSLYINMLRNSKDNYNKILHTNLAGYKIIRKVIESNILILKKDIDYYVENLNSFPKNEIEQYLSGHDSIMPHPKKILFMMYNYIRQFYPDNEILQKFLNNQKAISKYDNIDMFSINKNIFEMYVKSYGEEYGEIFQMIYEELTKLRIPFK